MKIRLAGVALACVGAAFLGAGPAVAAINLVTNGSFETIGSFNANKKQFSQAGVAGWSGGTGSFTFLDKPGSADNGTGLIVYDDIVNSVTVATFPITSPNGGNFVAADGDTAYRSAITQTINGLVTGKQYELTFYQAAGQQQGFSGNTTEHFSVSLGGDTQQSSTFHLISNATTKSFGRWQGQKMVFTASGASELLSFLASGTPHGAPPVSFLDGVRLSAVPEPASWALMIVGFGAVGGTVRRRRATTIAA